jgi:hypothetical protein
LNGFGFYAYRLSGFFAEDTKGTHAHAPR